MAVINAGYFPGLVAFSLLLQDNHTVVNHVISGHIDEVKHKKQFAYVNVVK